MALVSYVSSGESDLEDAANNLAETSDDVSKSKRVRPRQPVRIGLPTAPEPDSDDDLEPPDKKSRLKSHPGGGGGVASFLPKPKKFQFGKGGRSGKGLAGNSAEKTAQLRAQFLKKPKTEEQQQDSDEEEEDIKIGPSSFFSLDSLSTAATHELLPAPGPQLPADPEKYMESGNAGYPQIEEGGQQSHYVDPTLYENDEAFKRLQCGKKIKPKGKKNDIQIVSIDEKDQIKERLQMQRKMATQEKPKRPAISKESYDNADMKFLTRIPTSDMRRKHQMTWLVYQANEREHMLEEQWSAQRQTRRQTQAKYGF